MLYNADMLSIIRFMPDNSVDLICTDPPYRTIPGGNKNPAAPRGMLHANDGKVFKHNDIKIEEYAGELFRVLKDRGHIYLFTNYKNHIHHQLVLESVGFTLSNLLIWKKQNATPSRSHMRNCEYVIFARKGAVKSLNDNGSKTCHEFMNPTGNKYHPTEKPVDLLQFYIENSTLPGEVVFDPFAGAGSTALACMKSGRRFIGCEIDHDHFNVAKRRISEISQV